MRAWLVGVVTACACFSEDIGSDEGSVDTTSINEGSTTAMGESTTATTGTLADSSTTAACGDATEVPAIPEGWEGPVSVRAHDIGDRIACPDDREEVRRAWVTGAPTRCECACAGDPAQLCALVIDTSTSCNGAEIPTASTCVPSGTSFVQVGIAPSECTPEATLRIPD